jgi:hypothetical protein
MSASKKKKAERTSGPRAKSSSGRDGEARTEKASTEKASIKASMKASMSASLSAGTPEPLPPPRGGQGHGHSNGRDAVMALSAPARGNPPALPTPIATFTV